MTRHRWILITGLIGGILAEAGQASPAHAGLAQAQAAYNAGDFAAAFKELKPVADSGDAEAQALIAGMYARGQGVPVDPAEAARWYAMAADQEHLYATTMLGWFYMRGIGVEQDAVKGYRLLSRAAARGQPRAVEMKQAVAEKALAGLDDLAETEARSQSIDLEAAVRIVLGNRCGVMRLQVADASLDARRHDRRILGGMRCLGGNGWAGSRWRCCSR